MLLSIPQALLVSIACKQCRQAMHVRNGRTYVRTTHLSNYLALGNARRGAARFSPIGGI